MAETLAYEFGPDSYEPNYSYLKGDLSYGYNYDGTEYTYTDRADGYERSFMFLNLKNEKYPAAMIVFDRVKSTDPSFKKTWLLHTVQEPEVTGTQTVVTDTRTGYNGKMVVDTLLPASPEIKVVDDKTLYDGTILNVSDLEATLGTTQYNESNKYRVEISPSAAQQEDYFLNVMQVSDAYPVSEPLPVEMIDSTTHVGAKIADRVVLFGKQKDKYTSDTTVSFTFAGDGEYEITVADLTDGTWNVTKDGADYDSIYVKKNGGIALINGEAGTYTLSWSSSANEPAAISSWLNKYADLLPNATLTTYEVSSEDYSAETSKIYDEVAIIDYSGYYYTSGSYGGETIVYLNSKAIDVDDVAMIPLDNISKVLYINHKYDSVANTVTFDGFGSAFECIPQDIDGTLYVPFKTVADAFGYTYTDKTYPKAIKLNYRSNRSKVIKVNTDIGEGGSLSYDNDTLYAISGNTLLVDIIPDAGYVVDTVTFGGNEITTVDANGGSYETTALTADTTLEVTFKADDSIPVVSVPAQYTEAVDLASLNNRVSGTEITALTDRAALLAFATVTNNNENYVLADYGMLLSKEESNPKIGTAKCRKISVKNNFSTTMSTFGLILYGNAIVNGESYYVRPYATYTYNGDVITYYGDVKAYEAKTTVK